MSEAVTHVLELAQRAVYHLTWSEAPPEIATESLRKDYLAQYWALRKECDSLAKTMMQRGLDGDALQYFVSQAHELGEAQALEEIATTRLAMPMSQDEREQWQLDLDSLLERKERFEERVRRERAAAGIEVSK